MGLIYVDACLLIYAFEAHPVHGSAVRARLAHAAGQLAISPLVHLECLVGPMKTGNLVLQRYYEEGLQQTKRACNSWSTCPCPMPCSFKQRNCAPVTA